MTLTFKDAYNAIAGKEDCLTATNILMHMALNDELKNPAHVKTLRDEFAMAALSALVSRETIQDPNNNNLAKWAVMNPQQNYYEQAKRAYEYADAMMKEREK